MGWYDTDVSRFELNQLHLPRGPAWEGEQLLTQTSQAQSIIKGFVDRQLLWRSREGEYVDTVQQGDDNSRFGETNTKDGSTKLEGDGSFLLRIVPYDQLEEDSEGKSTDRKYCDELSSLLCSEGTWDCALHQR